MGQVTLQDAAVKGSGGAETKAEAPTEAGTPDGVGAAAAAQGGVALQLQVGGDQLASLILDAAARGEAAPEVVGASAADGGVARDRAVSDEQGPTHMPDAAALSQGTDTIRAIAADGLVAGDATIGDGERPNIGDAAARPGTGEVIVSRIVWIVVTKVAALGQVAANRGSVHDQRACVEDAAPQRLADGVDAIRLVTADG